MLKSVTVIKLKKNTEYFEIKDKFGSKNKSNLQVSKVMFVGVLKENKCQEENKIDVITVPGVSIKICNRRKCANKTKSL